MCWKIPAPPGLILHSCLDGADPFSRSILANRTSRSYTAELLSCIQFNFYVSGIRTNKIEQLLQTALSLVYLVGMGFHRFSPWWFSVEEASRSPAEPRRFRRK